MMDAIGFFLLRYQELHRRLVDDLLSRLTDAQARGRPHPGVNTVAWLIWHSARIEDVGVNRFLADRPQVLDDGWSGRLALSRRDVGTGMSDAEVDSLSAVVDLQALRGYWRAVTDRTLDVVETLRTTDLDVPVPAEVVQRVSFAEGAVSPGAAWLSDFWASGRSRAWFLAQVPLLHVYGHYFEARVTMGLWGQRSP
jgi:DinB family protein